MKLTIEPTIWPPAMTSDGQWHIQTGESEAEHSAEEVFNALVPGVHI